MLRAYVQSQPVGVPSTLGAIDWEKRKMLLAGLTSGVFILLGLTATYWVRRIKNKSEMPSRGTV